MGADTGGGGDVGGTRPPAEKYKGTSPRNRHLQSLTLRKILDAINVITSSGL